MFVHVERGSSVPISRQISEQLRSQCVSGSLVAGEKLPSVRELALQLAVNVNTVVRIYERLAAEGLIELRHGDGTYVLPSKRQGDSQLEVERVKFDREFELLVHRGLMLGYSPAELRTRLSAALTVVRQVQKS